MKRYLILLFAIILSAGAYTQAPVYDTEPGRFDYGKMWTFENPPLDYLKEAHGFESDQEWFDRARKSSLRFATWCSASFISPRGLIMTNHHCSENVLRRLDERRGRF